MRISDWSSDVCSSDLRHLPIPLPKATKNATFRRWRAPPANQIRFRGMQKGEGLFSVLNLQELIRISLKLCLPEKTMLWWFLTHQRGTWALRGLCSELKARQVEQCIDRKSKRLNSSH